MMLIPGNRIVLRTTTRQDLPDLLALWNDGRVMQWVGFPHGLGYDADRVSQWFGHIQSQPGCNHFTVRADGVGFCGEVYYEVDQEHQRAALDIKLKPEAQGQGLASDALRTLIRRVFETEKDVQVVWTEPRAENTASRKLYARCGLKPEPRPLDLEPFESYLALSRDKWSKISGGVAMTVKPIPEGYHSVTPYLIVSGVAGLIDFIKQAFAGAELERLQRPDGTIMHAEVRIGDSIVMMGEPSNEFTPMPASLHLYVEDADKVYRRALEAGATPVQEPADQFYGDRTAGVKDAYGNFWWIATHIKDVSAEELIRQTRGG